MGLCSEVDLDLATLSFTTIHNGKTCQANPRGRGLTHGLFLGDVVTSTGLLRAGAFSAAVGLVLAAVAAHAESAGGSAAINSSVPRCNFTNGTIAIANEDETSSQRLSTEARMGSLIPLLRNTVLASNCFQITSQTDSRIDSKLDALGAGSRRDIYRPNNKGEKNQAIVSDYYMVPTVNFAGASRDRADEPPPAARQQPRPQFNPNILGAVGGRWGQAAAQAFNSYGTERSSRDVEPRSRPQVTQVGTAEVTLEVYDVRARVLIASARGVGRSAAADDTRGSFRGASADTPAARAVAYAIDDAYRQLVPAVVNYRAQSIRGGAGNGGRLNVN